MTPEVKKVFDDLTDYLRFCKTFGHPYNEADLYNSNSEVYLEYRKLKEGTRISNNWMRDAKIFGRKIFGLPYKK
ncbi:MAG: hypothetical protein H8D23_05025 [Candidatus Brocadiales bacterium]|nr:hypothetical protein [Candidatus Brocadiales bacterium]